MRPRVFYAIALVAVMAAGNGALVAAGSGSGNAADSQYKPGCGPKKSGGTNPSGTHTGPPGLVGGLTSHLPVVGTSSTSSGTSTCPKK